MIIGKQNGIISIHRCADIKPGLLNRTIPIASDFSVQGNGAIFIPLMSIGYNHRCENDQLGFWRIDCRLIRVLYGRDCGLIIISTGGWVTL